jgi:hypothetical protein
MQDHDRQRAAFRQYQRDQRHLYRDLGAHHLWHGPGAGIGGLVHVIASLAITVTQAVFWLLALPVRLVLRRRRAGD